MKNFMFMKKISLLMLAFMSGFGFVQAQTTTMDPDKAHKPLRTEMSSATRFGLRVGANLASLELDDDYNGTTYNTNSKTSFHAGVFVNVPLGSTLRFQPELSYVGGGSKVNGNFLSPANVNNTGSYELDYHYIAVPLMVQLQTKSGFFVEAGPQFAYSVMAQEERNNGETDLKDIDLIRKTDFALAGGLGYLTRVGLGINARYVHGLSNVYNSDNAPTGQTEKEVSNRWIQLGLTYHFGAAK
jgi:hypothetical protein